MLHPSTRLACENLIAYLKQGGNLIMATKYNAKTKLYKAYNWD